MTQSPKILAIASRTILLKFDRTVIATVGSGVGI